MSAPSVERAEAAELLRLAKEATPGPWAWAQTTEKGYGANVGADVFADDDDNCQRPLSGDLSDRDDYDVGRGVAELFYQDAAANAAFIAYANPERIASLCAALLSTADALKEARKDTARLDWMNEHGASVDVQDTDCLPCTVQSSNDYEATGRVRSYDIREAIDRAASEAPNAV